MLEKNELVPNAFVNKTYQLFADVDTHLLHCGEIFGLVYLNLLSINLKLPDGYMNNNIMIVMPKGMGKSTFMNKILDCKKRKTAESALIRLPTKMFESFLAENNIKFHRHIIYHDDLIQGLFGLSEKQKAQIIGFFTEMMSGKTYSRQGPKGINTVNGDCLIIFCVAAEHFFKYYSRYTESTLLDRMVVLFHGFDDNDKMEILEREQLVNEGIIPPVKLMVKVTEKRNVNISAHKFNSHRDWVYLLNEDILFLHKYTGNSPVRLKQQAMTFMMSNALYNDRQEIDINDYFVYKNSLFKYITGLKIALQSKWDDYTLIKQPRLGDISIAKMLDMDLSLFILMKKIFHNNELENYNHQWRNRFRGLVVAKLINN